MRTMIVNILLFAIVGGTLARAGVLASNPIFWIIMVCMGGVQLNNALSED